MRCAIVQGVEVPTDSRMHVFAVDSHKHSVEMFLRSAELMPSAGDARELRGTRTPMVHVVLASKAQVEMFDGRLREVIPRLFELLEGQDQRGFEEELARYQVGAARSPGAMDEVMFRLAIRAIFPSPSEIRFPAVTALVCGEKMAFGLWTVAEPREEKRRRPQVTRLLEGWLAIIGEVEARE